MTMFHEFRGVSWKSSARRPRAARLFQQRLLAIDTIFTLQVGLKRFAFFLACLTVFHGSIVYASSTFPLSSEYAKITYAENMIEVKERVEKRMQNRKASSVKKMGMLLRNCIFLMMIVLFPSSSFSGVLLEEKFHYVVAQGETLSSIGSTIGVDWKHIARENKLDPTTALKAGRRLRITSKKIIPEMIQQGILIDVPGRMLYFFENGAPILAVPVGLGMPKKNGNKGWETPSGTFTIKGKLKSPDWKVPKSIQEEMRREGLVVKESYPPGPKNPVGGYVLLTTIPGILIHETIDPLSINRYVSHGCVRVLREDMEQLFENVVAGLPGEIIYRPIKIASRSDGRVFMEVNNDVYEGVKDMQVEARRLIEKAGLIDSVDVNKVMKVVQEQKGIPEEVTAKGL